MFLLVFRVSDITTASMVDGKCQQLFVKITHFSSTFLRETQFLTFQCNAFWFYWVHYCQKVYYKIKKIKINTYGFKRTINHKTSRRVRTVPPLLHRHVGNDGNVLYPHRPILYPWAKRGHCARVMGPAEFTS